MNATRLKFRLELIRVFGVILAKLAIGKLWGTDSAAGSKSPKVADEPHPYAPVPDEPRMHGWE